MTPSSADRKHCPSCSITKPTSEFYEVTKRLKSGVVKRPGPYCIVCTKAKTMASYIPAVGNCQICSDPVSRGRYLPGGDRVCSQCHRWLVDGPEPLFAEEAVIEAATVRMKWARWHLDQWNVLAEHFGEVGRRPAANVYWQGVPSQEIDGAGECRASSHDGCEDFARRCQAILLYVAQHRQDWPGLTAVVRVRS